MYIRTKDGVYDLENDDIVKIDGKYKECYVQKDTGDTCFKDIEILNQSENLEELCDEGVIEVKFSSTGYIAHFNKNIDELRRFLKYLEECQPITKDEILNVYGAVWCEFGLKYVAKMNDKGELELI